MYTNSEFVNDIKNISKYLAEDYKINNKFTDDIYELLEIKQHKLIIDNKYFITSDNFQWYKTNGENYLIIEILKILNNFPAEHYTRLTQIYDIIYELLEFKIENAIF